MRHTIFNSRATRHLPSPEMLEELLIDELRRKYSGDRVEKYINNKDEQLAIVSLVQKKVEYRPCCRNWITQNNQLKLDENIKVVH